MNALAEVRIVVHYGTSTRGTFRLPIGLAIRGAGELSAVPRRSRVMHDDVMRRGHHLGRMPKHIVKTLQEVSRRSAESPVITPHAGMAIFAPSCFNRNSPDHGYGH